MINTLPTLTHNTPIRAAAWLDIFFARTFTTRGYAVEHGRDPEAMVAHAIANRHDLVTSTARGAILTDDVAGNHRRNEELRAISASAVTLAPGDHVLIEGEEYIVNFPQFCETKTGPRLSDPIHFRKVVAA